MRPKRLAALAALALALAAPAPALGGQPPCEGDECQGPPPAPEEVIPATAVVDGPSNPPVHFAGQKHPKAHKHKNKNKTTHKSHSHKQGGKRG
jgi:hypothetical protein